MKLKTIYFFLCSTTIIFFSGCKNDLELNAPYKEVPNVYAILNPQEQLQIIRINKVFLGEGDANQMAKVADSVNYQPGELTVTLKHSSVAGVITFRDSVLTTESGAFASKQQVYVTNEKIVTAGTYTLTIKNNKTGNFFTAKSEALDSVKPSWPPFRGPYYPVAPGSNPLNQDNYVNYSGQNTIYSMRFTANEAKLYQMVMRLHYYDSLDGGTNSYHYADYNFSNQYEKDKVPLSSGSFPGTLFANFRGKDVFSAIGTSLSKTSLNPAVFGRKMYKAQFFIYSSTQDYLDFLEFAKPSLNIAQNKPLFSNFDNNAAIGIFTFRSRCMVTKNISNDFISEFQRNPATCSYRFFNADLSRSTCP